MKSTPLFVALALCSADPLALGQAPNWTRISYGLGGTDPAADSFGPQISADGRYVAYSSEALNIAAGDIDFVSDVFVFDRVTGLTTLESVDAQGGHTTVPALAAAICGDGTCVAFVTSASLTSTSSNGNFALYVRDLNAGATELISIGHGGASPNGGSATDQFGLPRSVGMSHDGRYVAFGSSASNLVLGDTNFTGDIFVRDRVLGLTERVSVGPGGLQSDGASLSPTISSDGRFVAYESRATNIVGPDGNNTYDVFLHDRLLGRTVRCSSAPTGTPGSLLSTNASLSGDGRFVAFSSLAANLDGPTQSQTQVFLYDAVDSSVRMLSRTNAGVPYGGEIPRVSASGSHVAFYTNAAGPVPGAPPALPGIYVHELATGALRWACAGPLGTGFSGFSPSISADGRFCTVATDASGIAGVDNNQLFDIYLFDATSGDWPDLDGDGRGDASGAFALGANSSPGRAGNTLDCDDSNPTRYAGAPELLDGIDNDCDAAIDEGVIEVYCTASVTSGGCAPHLAHRGAPRLGSASGFVIDVHGVDGQRSGVLFYGVDNSSFSPLVWAAGSSSFLCVRSPIQRSLAQNSGGTAGVCDGLFSLDWLAFVFANPASLGAPFALGDDVYLQAWFRDPPAPRSTNLSDAVRFTMR